MKFSIKEAFTSAFKIFSQNFFGIFSFPFLCFMLVGISSYFIYYFKAPFYFLILIGILTNYMLYYAFTSTFLPAFRGSEIKFKTFFLVSRPDLAKVIFKLLLGNILLSLLFAVPVTILSFFLLLAMQSSSSVSVLLVIALCILIFVWFVILFRYCFFFIEIFEVKLVFQSFRNSAKLVSGNICKLLLLLFLLILMNLAEPILCNVLILFVEIISITETMETMVSIIAVLISIIVMSFTLPFSILVWIHVYTQLSSSKSNPQQIRKEAIARLN